MQYIGAILLQLVSLRDKCFEKKAINLPKKNKWTIITPGVDYERPNCSFLIVTKRCDEYSDSASKTITFAFKTTDNCFKQRSLLSDTKKHICTFFFSLSSMPVLWFFCECSWDLFAVLWQVVEHFMSNQRILLIFLRTRVISLTMKILGFKSLLLKTTEPIVQLLGFASLFRVYFQSDSINSGKRKVLFSNILPEKIPLFPTNKLGSCPSFWANWSFRWFTLLLFKMFVIIQSAM